VRYLLLLSLLWTSCAFAGDVESVTLVEDADLNFFLNNAQILLEKKDPDEFPSVLRLTTLPERGDDCLWLPEVEKPCALEQMYLSLWYFDTYPEQHNYLIGSAISWRVVSLSMREQELHTYWDAVLTLEAVTLVDGRQRREMIEVEIKNRYTVYEISIGQRRFITQ
jgi:hypothetical protein